MNLNTPRPASLGLLLALACAPLLSLSGCGGGGNDDVNVTPVVSGTPTSTAIPTATSSGQTVFQPNYLNSVQDRLRWPGFPIRVYFVPNSNFTSARRDLAVTGFNQWVTATQNGVRYNVVSDSAQADISVTFSAFSGSAGDELGVANITYEQNTNRIIRVAMNIGITGDNREDVQTAAHEFGHSLGIGGHSDTPADLMFPTGNSAGCSCITQRDLNTLLTIYGGQFNTRTNARSNAVTGPTRTITIH